MCRERERVRRGKGKEEKEDEGRNEVKTPLADPAAVICARVGSVASGDDERRRFMAYL